LEQFVLVCFFAAELESFAGCVNKRQQTSIGVNESHWEFNGARRKIQRMLEDS